MGFDVALLSRRRRGRAFYGVYGAYILDGRLPSLIADLRNNVFATRSLDVYDYALAGQPAALVTSFRDNAYLTSGRETMTAHTRHGLITSGRSTTMIVRDSDGIYKHGAHNLYRNGAGGAQSITVVSGRDYTIRMKGTGSIGYSGAATGTLSGTGADDVVRVEVTATTTTLTVTPSGSVSEIAVYQSDLGGMQFTSDGTDYVENNTGAALYAAPVEYDVNGVRSMPIWEARTNLFAYPMVLSDASWSVTRASATENAAVSPDGTQNADKLVEDATASASHGALRRAVTYTAGLHTFSFYAKAAERSFVRTYIDSSLNSAGVNINVWFDISSGTVETQSNTTSGKIVPVGNGWYRCSVEFTANAGASTGAQVFIADADNSSFYNGDGTSGIYLWLMQVEAGLGASPPMNGGASTFARAADNLYTLATSFGYRQTEGTIVAEFESVGSDGVDFPSIAFLHDGSSDNRIALLLNTTNNAYADARVGAVGQMGITLGSYTPNGQSKAALGTKQDSFAGSLEGATVATDSSGSHPSGITTLQYGRSDTGQHLNGKLYSLAYYPFRAANSDLEAASA